MSSQPISRLLAAAILVACSASLAGAQAVPAAPAARPAGPPSQTWERSFVQALRPTPAGVKYQLNISESLIEAATVAEFLTKRRDASRNMVELRSGRSPGSYQWRLETPFRQENHMDRCQFKNIDVRLGYDADIVMLAGPVAQDSAAVVWWDRAIDSFYANHLERIRAMRDAGKALHQKLRLMTHSSCVELANLANTAARDARFELNERMRALGGVVIPLDDRPR